MPSKLLYKCVCDLISPGVPGRIHFTACASLWRLAELLPAQDWGETPHPCDAPGHAQLDFKLQQRSTHVSARGDAQQPVTMIGLCCDVFARRLYYGRATRVVSVVPSELSFRVLNPS